MNRIYESDDDDDDMSFESADMSESDESSLNDSNESDTEHGATSAPAPAAAAVDGVGWSRRPAGTHATLQVAYNMLQGAQTMAINLNHMIGLASSYMLSAHATHDAHIHGSDESVITADRKRKSPPPPVTAPTAKRRKPREHATPSEAVVAGLKQSSKHQLNTPVKDAALRKKRTRRPDPGTEIVATTKGGQLTSDKDKGRSVEEADQVQQQQQRAVGVVDENSADETGGGVDDDNDDENSMDAFVALVNKGAAIAGSSSSSKNGSVKSTRSASRVVGGAADDGDLLSSLEQKFGSAEKAQAFLKNNPEPPANACHAFNFFKRARGEQLRAQRPDLKSNMGKQATILSQMFKTLSDAEKEEYNAMAAADKLRYETEMAAYNKQYPGLLEQRKEAKRYLDELRKSGVVVRAAPTRKRAAGGTSAKSDAPIVPSNASDVRLEAKTVSNSAGQNVDTSAATTASKQRASTSEQKVSPRAKPQHAPAATAGQAASSGAKPSAKVQQPQQHKDDGDQESQDDSEEVDDEQAVLQKAALAAQQRLHNAKANNRNQPQVSAVPRQLQQAVTHDEEEEEEAEYDEEDDEEEEEEEEEGEEEDSENNQ